VAATVEEVVESLGPIAREKGLEVGCLVEGPSQPLRGDRDRFRQIVVNLVANAIKYTERGEVAVFAEATGGPEDLVTVAVHVADTGVGIPAEAADLVFEPFGQAASGRPSGGGTGLGLTISRQLALLMGGDIRFESEPGRGSVFHLSVTLGRPTDPEEVRPVPRLSVRRVLVAEPHPLARFVLERHCTQLGIEVRGVADGEGALAALRAAAAGARTFDVALVASGLLAGGQADLLRGLRQASAAGTRVVAVGAPAEGALPTGAVHVLPRPVLRKSLLEALSPSSPVEAEPVVASPASWLSPEARDRRGLVLVVEDNPVNQTVAEGMLGVLGIDAHVAADGAAALACLERTRYDVVLMDCMMPGMDGFEATAELRRRESEQGVAPTPVIALTAIAMPGDRERCLAAGMNDYLAKPFQIETLEAALARVFPRPGAGPAPALGAVGAP
jgi:CheY-like chemotaxis protein